jgi:hypothetical protein
MAKYLLVLHVEAVERRNTLGEVGVQAGLALLRRGVTKVRTKNEEKRNTMGRGSDKEGTKEEEARSIGTTYVGQKSVQERVDARVGLALDIDNEPVLRERTGLWRDSETTNNGWVGDVRGRWA